MKQEVENNTFFGFSVTEKKDVEKSDAEKVIYMKYLSFIKGTEKITQTVIDKYNDDLKSLRIAFHVVVLCFSLPLLYLSCSSVESRMKDYSYTDIWYYENNQVYQVYKTDRNNYYIVVPNKNNNKLVRKYIKKP